MALFTRNKPFEVDVSKAVEEWSDTVFRIAKSLMGNSKDAEDVTQCVFMRLLKSKNRINNEIQLKEWLIRTALICSQEELRKRINLIDSADQECICSPEYNEAIYPELEEAINNLRPPVRRAVLLLYYFEDYSTKEIANIMGITEATVRSHLFRARESLRITMEGDRNEGK